MTTIPGSPVGSPPLTTPSYVNAHWYFLAALAAIVAGFWPSFFRPLGTGDFAHSLHGVTATLWIMLLAAQSWLMANGHVTWHRRTGRTAVLVVLPVLVVSALYMVGVMFGNRGMPPFLPPLIALIVSDRRSGQRELIAYPLSLAFFVAVHALMLPVANSALWNSMMAWYAALPVFG